MSEHVVYLLGPYKVLNVERFVRVYVADERRKGAPAVYMFDGQNIFHDAPSFSGGWHVHQTVRALANQGRPAPVVVGIDHGGPDRLHELSPFACKDSRGQLDELLGWIRRELVPLVRRRFGTSEDPAANIIAGSSMGGLAATCAHFRMPELFGGAIAMSPSYWFAGRSIFDWVAQQPKPARSRLYLDAGAKEGQFSVVRDVERLAAQLRARGWDEASLRVVIDPVGGHCEAAWRHRIGPALEFALAPPASLPAEAPAREASPMSAP